MLSVKKKLFENHISSFIFTFYVRMKPYSMKVLDKHKRKIKNWNSPNEHQRPLQHLLELHLNGGARLLHTKIPTSREFNWAVLVDGIRNKNADPVF